MVGLKNSLIGLLMLLSLSSCAQNKELKIQEVCFSRYNELNEIELVCYDRDGKEYTRYGADSDKYTCFNPKEASKIAAFIDKCLSQGVKP